MTTATAVKSFDLYSHEKRSSSRFAANNLIEAKHLAERKAGLANQGIYTWAWRTLERGIYVLYVIRGHKVVRSYTLRPDWR
jgi:hypothetical protein